MRWKVFYLALGVGLIALFYWASRSIQYCGWDFRNSLWGPIHMLVQGQTPYTYATPYGAYAGVWMPFSLGAFLWLGLLSCDMGSKLWLLVEISGFIAMVWLFDEHHHPRLWILATCTLALFLFPPLWVHIFLGQFSMLFAILMIALAFLPRASPWMPLILAVGLTKPQLCLLIYPGLVIYTWRHQGFHAAARMVLSTVLCLAVFMLPLFLFYPDWIRDYLFIASSNFGKTWDLPTLFVQLPVLFGQAGYVIWGALLVIVAGVTTWLWYTQDKRIAMIFSLALTPLVATYASSWDFLLLLPAFYWLLIRTKNLWGKMVLLGGMVMVNGFLYAARWHHDIQDSSQWWVAPILIINFATVVLIEHYRELSFKKHQVLSAGDVVSE